MGELRNQILAEIEAKRKQLREISVVGQFGK